MDYTDSIKNGNKVIKPEKMSPRHNLLLCEEVASKWFSKDKTKDIVVLHINHCMENSFELCRVLDSAFETVVFIGAPYNEMLPPADESFVSYGARNTADEEHFKIFRQGDVIEEFSGGFIEIVQKMIEKALIRDIIPLLEEGKRLLVIEDGGYHYQVIRRLYEEYPVLKDRVMGAVEQTTSGTVRGYNLAQNQGYWYPHLSVSRSKIKMNIEARFISERVVEELSRFLYGINTFYEFHEILVLGYGVIGRGVAQLLKARAVDIRVYDTDPDIMEVARNDGHQTVSSADYGGFSTDTIIIGNTGFASLDEHMLSCFFEGEGRNLYLASSSSQDVEFKTFLEMISGERLLPRGVELKAIYAFAGSDEYVFKCADRNGNEIKKSVFLIAKGRPVNFFRKNVISLTNCMIDLIFAQMIMMGSWILRHPEALKKLHLLGAEEELKDESSEKELLKRWLELYHFSEEKGLSLFNSPHPKWQSLQGRLLNREDINGTD